MNKLESLSQIAKQLQTKSAVHPFGCCWCVQQIIAEDGYYRRPEGNYHPDCFDWMKREKQQKESA